MPSLSNNGPITLQPSAARALALLHGAGFDAYVVGGCVRDALMGAPCHDWDVTTSASPADTMRVFRDCRVIETGLQHGTVTVLLDGFPIEITTFRADGTYSDGRHPDAVRFSSSVTEDLARRDFTMNAVAYAECTGLIDPYGGAEDITRRVIRCVGDAEARFLEDGLRILRAVRFAAQLGFAIERETEAALYRCSGMLARVSAERKATEICKLICAPHAAETVTGYADLLRMVLPVAERAGELLKRLPESRELRFAALLSELVPGDARKALRGLKLDRKLFEAVPTLLAAAREALPESVPEIKRAMGRYGMLWQDILTFRAAFYHENDPPYREIDAVRRETARILEQNECVTLAALAIDGRELLSQGIAGREIGKTLQILLDAVIEGRISNDKTALLAYLQSTSNENR